LAIFCLEKSEKTHISICHVNKRSEWLIQRFKVGLTEAERERERQIARINRQRCGKEVRERAGHGYEEGAIVLLNNAVN